MGCVGAPWWAGEVGGLGEGKAGMDGGAAVMSVVLGAGRRLGGREEG